MFQSTRPHGARPNSLKVSPLSWVSIHAPAWGATYKGGSKSSRKRFQSTRPHGARLNATSTLFTFSDVSIHAPAWGATQFTKGLIKSSFVSIHAPAWGATMVRLMVGRITMFQSTRPHGARLLFGLEVHFRLCFNPRARMGRDLYYNR